MLLSPISRNKLSSVLITFALLILGLFSETTPSKFGIAEVAIILFLITPYFITIRKLNRQLYYFCCVLFLLILLGILGSVTNNVDFSNFVRDIIPFLFFFIVIVLQALDEENNSDIIMYGMMFVGIAFSVRYLLGVNVQLNEIGTGFYHDKTYLMQDPACLFAALFSINKMFWCLRNRETLLAACFCVTFLLVAMAFLLMGVRAALGIIIFYLFIMIWCYLRSAIFTLFLSLFISYYFYANGWIFESVIQKFYDAGLNNKDVEALYVLEYVTTDLNILLLGVGFGGTFFNPVYAEFIRYTHNIVTYNLLKFGVLGLLITSPVVLLHVYDLSRKVLSAVVYKKIDMYIVILLTMIPSMYLQPTFKSLSFCILFSFFLIRGLKIDSCSNTYP